ASSTFPSRSGVIRAVITPLNKGAVIGTMVLRGNEAMRPEAKRGRLGCRRGRRNRHEKGIGHGMIATSLTAALALLAPAPESLVPQTPDTAVGPQGAQARTLNDQDTELFRQGLERGRARDVIGTREAAARISDPVARKLVEWALIDASATQLPYSGLAAAQTSM